MRIHKVHIFLQNFHKTPCGCLITIKNLNADYTEVCQDDHVCLESSPGLPVSLDCLLCWFNCKLSRGGLCLHVLEQSESKDLARAHRSCGRRENKNILEV